MPKNVRIKETVNYHCDVLEAKKLKETSPRLPIIIQADNLYASDPVMNICRGNQWDFIIRYKIWSILGITEEYEKISEKETLPMISKLSRKLWMIKHVISSS